MVKVYIIAYQSHTHIMLKMCKNREVHVERHKTHSKNFFKTPS